MLSPPFRLLLRPSQLSPRNQKNAFLWGTSLGRLPRLPCASHPARKSSHPRPPWTAPSMATPQRHRVFPAGSSLLRVGGALAPRIVYLSWHGPIPHRELMTRHLPVWGIFHSLVIWWPVWSVTEELTYNRYLASCFAALSRHRWVPYALVGFWWPCSAIFFPSSSICASFFIRFSSSFSACSTSWGSICAPEDLPR